jgi:hypothetical protein
MNLSDGAGRTGIPQQKQRGFFSRLESVFLVFLLGFGVLPDIRIA